ncbi:hypothetical protein MU582_00785 [Nocardioidaceae bacterium SCSIO 66511]|nr:hypothetical protein MU582_00785 [Nocardioidaceae bacterium SCSIO 66511]
MRRLTGCVVLTLTAALSMTGAQAQASADVRQPPATPAYLNTNTMVVKDNGHRRVLDVDGSAESFYRTAHGYAVMSEVPRGDDSAVWLTIYGKRRGSEVLSRSVSRASYPTVAVSADGKRIAYVAQPSTQGLARLVVRRTSDGGLVRKRPLADPSTRVLAFRAGEVWFAQDRHFAGRFQVRSGKVRPVRKGRAPLIAVSPARDQAVVRNLTTHKASVVPLPRHGRKGWQLPEHDVLGWSPNGRYVLTYNWDDEGVVRRLVVRNSRSGRLVRGVSYNWFGSPPRIRWASSKAFLAVRGGEHGAELMRYGARKGAKVLATFPSWTPDVPGWLPIAAPGQGVATD